MPHHAENCSSLNESLQRPSEIDSDYPHLGDPWSFTQSKLSSWTGGNEDGSETSLRVPFYVVLAFKVDKCFTC